MDVNMGVLIPKENRHVEENTVGFHCRKTGKAVGIGPLLGSRGKTIELIPASW